MGGVQFFGGGGFHVYAAALPLYFAALGYEPSAIGLLLSVAALTELGSAFLIGPAIDRFGARVVLLFGLACQLAAAVTYAWLAALPVLVLARLLQGGSLAAMVPAVYSYVPGLVSSRHQVVAFSTLGMFANLAMATFPTVGLALLLGNGPWALFALAGTGSVVGLAFAAQAPAPRSSRRPFSLTFRCGWLPPMLVNMATVAQWGAITAFLPLVANAGGQNPALLFAADGVAVLLTRLPAAWMADRFGPLWLVLLGLGLSITSDLLLWLVPFSDPLLVLAGVVNGVGGAMVLPPLLAQLSRRSDDATRGTALSYFSVSVALGLVAGSGGGGLLYPWLSFPGLLALGAILCAAAALVALKDPLLRDPTRGGGATATQPAGAVAPRPVRA